jgi:hypothetical protein
VDANPASCFRSALRRKLCMLNNPGRRRTASMIVPGKRGVSADTAVRLAAALGTGERFWLGLQADCDLEEAHRAPGNKAARIERIAAYSRRKTGSGSSLAVQSLSGPRLSQRCSSALS